MIVPVIFSAPLSSRARPQSVNLPSVSNGTGFIGSTGPCNFKGESSSVKLHFLGSTFLFVAHCRKWSLLTSSLSTRIEVKGTEQVPLPVSVASSTDNVQPTAELTAVMRSPMAAPQTADKVLLPASGSDVNLVSAASAGAARAHSVSANAARTKRMENPFASRSGCERQADAGGSMRTLEDVQRFVDVPRRLQLRIEHVTDDALRIDDERHAARQQAECRGHAVLLAHGAARVSEQGERQFVFGRELPVRGLRVRAHADYLGTGFLERLVTVAEAASLLRTPWGVILWIEVENDGLLVAKVGEPDAFALRVGQLEVGCGLSHVNGRSAPSQDIQ